MSKQGIWLLFMLPNGQEPPCSVKRTRLFGEKPQRVHNIEATDDCDGDILFDYMTENGIIEDWNEYETEGDNEYVAIMHKTGDKPDFGWEFRAFKEPGPASDDCHTYS